SFFFFFVSSPAPRPLPSFPTRRSSDLAIDDDEHVLARSYALLGAIVIQAQELAIDLRTHESRCPKLCGNFDIRPVGRCRQGEGRSEEHTSELQSRFDIVCRLLLEKKNT